MLIIPPYGKVSYDNGTTFLLAFVLEDCTSIRTRTQNNLCWLIIEKTIDSNNNDSKSWVIGSYNTQDEAEAEGYKLIDAYERGDRVYRMPDKSVKDELKDSDNADKKA